MTGPEEAAALPPAVVVHGLEDVRTVLACGAPVTLLSAAGVAGYAGCGWWRALMQQATTEFPQVKSANFLDCGEASGIALAALRIGLANLVLSLAAPGRGGVEAVVAEQGGRLLPQPPASLDMAAPSAARRLHDWLRLRTAPGDSGPPVS